MYALHWMQWMREDYFYIEALMIVHVMVGNMSGCPASERCPFYQDCHCIAELRV